MTTYINSPRLVANGVGARRGTLEDYDHNALQYETGRFYRTLYETTDDDTADQVTGLVSAKEALDPETFQRFLERLFDDPNVTTTTVSFYGAKWYDNLLVMDWSTENRVGGVVLDPKGVIEVFEDEVGLLDRKTSNDLRIDEMLTTARKVIVA